MSEPIVFVDSSEIRPGKVDEARRAFQTLVEFVGANEPRAISYAVYLNEDETHVTVVQVHPDSASMELHMQAAADAFAGFQDLLELQTMDVYGAPSEELLERMRAKARMLGTATVRVHDLHAGLARFGPR
jgi:quinol monooxygenase YgiN